MLAEETSEVSAKRNLNTITLYHRTRVSSQFRQAADHILNRQREFGFNNAQIIEYPADGKTSFGTRKSRPSQDVELAPAVYPIPVGDIEEYLSALKSIGVIGKPHCIELEGV